jgi:primase-polymerase (primpol)-like protein
VFDAEGNLDPKAAEIVATLPGYVERSPSKKGLHILIKGALPAPSDRKNLKFGNVLRFDPENAPEDKTPGIEFYDETTPRYLTVTGDVWEERSTLNSEDGTQAIASIYWKIQNAHDSVKEAEVLAKKAARDSAKTQVTPVKANETSTKRGKFDYDDDNALIEHMRSSKGGDKFSRLFGGDYAGYQSHSEGVAALLMILAGWCRKDEARADRIFRQSALYDPEKWNRQQNGETLGLIEVRNACSLCSWQYDPDYHKERKQPSNLEIPSDINDELPTIVSKGRQLNPLLQEIDASLQADERLFRHGGGLVSIQDDGRLKHYTAEAMPKLLSRLPR